MRLRASRRLTIFVALGTVLALTSGCAAARDLGPAPLETPEYEPAYDEPAPYAVAPLTGAQVPVGSLTAPSLAAKVDNHPAARPQVGLERTDIVFEELVEGGLTRYVAVWHSDVPDTIGPVRSIRPMDPDIVSPLGGIIAYSGGQQRFVELMRNTPVYNAIHGQADTEDTFFRGDNAAAPHNVLVRAPQVIAQHDSLSAPAQQFPFAATVASATATKEGTPTTGISLRFGSAASPAWTWDSEGEHWLRLMTGGSADTDSSGAQLSAVNVVTLRVPVQVIQSIPTTQLIGSGQAWVSTGGGTVAATWSKASMTAPIRILDEYGVAVRLAPGNTWVELVPLAGDVSFSRP